MQDCSRIGADLEKETARILGMSRLGRKVSEAMSAGIELLVRRGLARREGDRVVGVRS